MNEHCESTIQNRYQYGNYSLKLMLQQQKYTQIHRKKDFHYYFPLDG